MWWTPIITMAQWRGPPLAQDGRYQNVGAAENLDYDYLLMGTLSRPILPWSPFSSVCQGRRGSSLSKADILRIFFFLWTWLWKPIRCGRFLGVDSNCWRRYDKENTWEAPTYLFDENLYNDVHYLLSKDTFSGISPTSCVRPGGVPGR